MLKFLFFTDSHFRDDKPRGRIDDIMKSQWDELGEILSICREQDVDAILHGGDFFNIKRPSHKLVVHILDWCRTLNLPIYGTIGNHDISAYNLDTVNNSGLGVLFESGALNRLDQEVFEDEKLIIKSVHSELHFQSHYTIDNKYKDYTKIILSHNYVIPMEKVPFEFMHPRDVETNADLVLCGHYHVPFDYTNGKTRWINPGALSRWALNERHNTPTVLLVTVDRGKVSIESIQLKSSRPGNEIFDETIIETQKQQEYDIKQFVKSLEETSFDDVDIETVAKTVGEKQNLPTGVLDIVLQNIRQAKESLK